MKKVMQNWRKYLLKEELGALDDTQIGQIGEPETEQQPAQAGTPAPAEPQAAAALSAEQLMGLDLPSFIKSVNSNKKAALEALMSGLNDGADPSDDQVGVEQVELVCRSLRPTQNEVVVDKSLKFTLENPSAFLGYLQSNGPFKVGPPNNNAIITFNGKYVIDGHHRWSSLYCVNPNAKITAYNIVKPNLDPSSMLKALQAAIFANLQQIPQNKGGGVNLFTASDREIENYITSVLAANPASIEAFKALPTPQNLAMREQAQQGFDQMAVAMATRAIAGIVVPNVKILQSESQPIQGATTRPSMPQADQVGPVAADAGTPKAIQPLEQGQVDIVPPFKGQKKAAE